MRVSHLAAVATLVALLGAMFVALPSVSAEPVTKVTKTIVTNTTTDPVTTQSVTITASDKDGIVADGKTVTFTATVDRSEVDNANVIATTSVAIAPYPGTQPSDAQTISNVDIHGLIVAAITFPRGTTNGEYTVTVTVDPGAGGGDAVPFVFTLENSEPGTPLASASIGFGKYTPADLGADNEQGGAGVNADTPATCAAPGATESADGASAKYGTPICLHVTALNSLGNPAQDEDIKEIIVSAPTASVYSPMAATATPTTLAGLGENAKTFKDDPDTGAADESPGSTQYFLVSRPKAAGTVEVSVLVIGEGTAGFADAGSLTLTFGGDPESLTLDSPSSPLAKSGNQSVVAVEGVDANDDDDFDDDGDTSPVEEKDLVGATVKVAAEDSSGNMAVLEPGDINPITVADANGKATDKVKATAKKLGTPPTTTIEVWSEGADPGTYTLTVKLGTKDTQTVDVVVTGKAANLELEADVSVVEIGDFVNVTATVTDADGNLQPDAGIVNFAAVGALKLEALDDEDSNMSGSQRKLNDGVATVEYAVVDGSGTATIVARINGVRGVVTVSTAPVEPEAMPEEEASVSCLSELSGFATWSCGVEADASAIFDMVTGRGVSAIHLWNGSTWVRYSVVDDAMVPGSSDFMVTENDILYISN